jgi:multidrug efflux pump
MGGFKLQLEDRASVGEAEMARAVSALVEKASKAPELAGVFSGYQTNVPQLAADVDREKVKRQGIALTDVFQTLQVYLGSQYVNDFSRFGRMYRWWRRPTRPSVPTPRRSGGWRCPTPAARWCPWAR